MLSTVMNIMFIALTYHYEDSVHVQGVLPLELNAAVSHHAPE